MKTDDFYPAVRSARRYEKWQSLATICLLAGALLPGCAGTRRAPPPTVPSAIVHEQDSSASESRGRPQIVALPGAGVWSSETPSPALPEVPAAGSIYFAFGSAKLAAEELKTLRSHAARLKADPKLTVLLEAHTDNHGSAAMNVAIAEKRLEAVAEALLSLGVARRQLRRSAMGNEGAPLGCSTACRRLMRRVDVLYPE